MILIKKHSKMTLVARGITKPFKSILKNYGFKWNRKLKGGPAYMLRLKNADDENKIIKNIYKDIEISGCVNREVDSIVFNKNGKRLLNNNKSDYPNKKINKYNWDMDLEMDNLYYNELCIFFAFQMFICFIFILNLKLVKLSKIDQLVNDQYEQVYNFLSSYDYNSLYSNIYNLTSTFDSVYNYNFTSTFDSVYNYNFTSTIDSVYNYNFTSAIDSVYKFNLTSNFNFTEMCYSVYFTDYFK